MEDLIIKESEVNPNVYFSLKSNKLTITGNSKMEDSKSFYAVIIKWLKDYTKSPNVLSLFEFGFLDINQSSLKMLLFVFQEIKSLQIDGHKVQIIWSFSKDKMYIKEMGQDISSMTDVFFTYKESNTVHSKIVELVV